MKILILGSGGREHALAWKFSQDGHDVVSCPGNPGMAELGELVSADITDSQVVVDIAKRNNVDLVVIGPEAPLVAGVADALRNEGIAVFGPGQKGAQLEGSKVFSKRFFEKYGIRTAPFYVCESMEQVTAALEVLGGSVAVKVDGLAAGKGVFVCDTKQEARQAASAVLENKSFGSAGQAIVIEKKILGREVSVMAITDGKRVEILAQAEDHKTIFDGDIGLNTGGMGAVSPPSWTTDSLVSELRETVFAPTLTGLAAEGIDYRGVLYAGIMIDKDGVAWLLEYNCRLGDPETQAIVVRLRSDLAQWLLGASVGALPEKSLEWKSDVSVSVILASKGYPGKSMTGLPIRGLDSVSEGVVVFHAGTMVQQDRTVTSGGRVLAVCALGETLENARTTAYDNVARIQFDGQQYRRDIGARKNNEKGKQEIL